MSILKTILKNLPISDKAKKAIRRAAKPAWLYFLRKNTQPLSTYYGFDRGKPIDRFYIEEFLEKNKINIRGTCLELLNNDYTVSYGGSQVSKSDILDIDTTNKNATIIDDLRSLIKIPAESYDCIVLTQVLQFIDDVDAAITQCQRVLKTGGVLLATLPSVSRIDNMSGIDGDYWRFTEASAKYLFQKQFNIERLVIESRGNARSGIYFYAGLAIEDITKSIFQDNDRNFPLIITVKATK